MSNEGLLENGYFKDVNLLSAKAPSLSSRAANWCVDLVRPAFWSSTPSGSDPPRRASLSQQSPQQQQPTLRRTAYLDGIRGFAAFLVYWMHHELWSHNTVDDVFQHAWGYQGKRHFITLPFIRTFFSGGHFAVSVFFVLSGYVLSNKPMRLIQSGDFLQLGDNLSSALFRRWLRLHLPVIGTTFAYITFLHMFHIHAVPDPQGSYGWEVWNWYTELKNFTFVFRTGGEPWFTYNFHSWSIPVEFRGSIVIYTVLMAFSRCTRNARLLCEVGLVYYFLYIADGWFCALFMSGMILCDLDQLAANRNLPRWMYNLEPYKHIIFPTLFVISLYLGGVPSFSFDINELIDAPGWYYLSFLKPQAVFDYKWFYLYWASTLLVASVPRLPWLKRFFETRFNQYLGRISFSFYLMHGPVLWTLGDRVYAAVGYTRQAHAINCPNWINRFPLKKSGPLGLEPAFFLTQVIILPTTLWLAEIVTRLFDEPSLRFAAWLYKKTLGSGVKA